jgi:FMN phosphatase YigB (HAD superfamily)
MDAFSRWTAPALNLNTLFDGILNSCELGAMKNDLESDGRSLFFNRYLTENDLRPSQCLLIDDSTDTAPAMQAIGLTYRQVTSRAQFIAELLALLQVT